LLGIIRGLAKALAAAGDDLLGREMRRAPLDDLDPRELLNLLRERLLARPSVVVLDDIHHADPLDTEMLFDALADLVARRSTRLLLVGRQQIESLSFPPLQGLSERDARILWSGAVALSAEQWWALYETTGGLPTLLLLVAAAYRRAGDLLRPDDWPVEIAAWAHDEIWSRLQPDEQRLLAAAHALYPRPWADHAALVCEALGVAPETFTALRGRALLTINRAVVAPFAALREQAEALLGQDGALREQGEILATGLEESAPDQSAEMDEVAVPPIAPAGLELIERVREALHLSATYLQEQQDDQVAHQLAAELALLQGALPDPAGPPSALARTLGDSAREKPDG
jgi:hypothetical protein